MTRRTRRMRSTRRGNLSWRQSCYVRSTEEMASCNGTREGKWFLIVYVMKNLLFGHV